MNTTFEAMKKTLLATLLSFTFASQAEAALTAYYSLDNLSSGIQNQGTDGAASNLSALDAAATPTVVSGGIIGGALSFDGNDLLRSLTAGNAGDDLAAYPFTMSIWARNVTIDSSRDAVFSVSNRTVADRYYTLGVDGSSGTRAEPELIRRNTAFTEMNATNANVSGATWSNIVTVFGTGGGQIYVDGKLVNSVAGGQTFSDTVDTISIGGFLRNNATAPTDPFRGEADDAGLFDTALLNSDIALINGLGRTGGIGLDQFDEAQALLALSTGSTALIGGYTWERVAGLAGTTGDFGGTTVGGNAFIVTDALGNGIQVTAIPEPSTVLLVASGIGLLGWRQLRKRHH